MSDGMYCVLHFLARSLWRLGGGALAVLMFYTDIVTLFLCHR